MRRIICLLALCPVGVASQESNHSDVSAQFHSGWESHYFSEGRDSLNGDGLWTNSVDVGWSFLAGRVFYASSQQTRYDELQLEISASHSIGDVEAYLAYTYYKFPIDNADDNEIAVGISWPGLPANLVFAADVVYSVDVDGSFIDLAVGREFDATDQLSLAALGIFSINKGYIAAGHTGANNFMFLLESAYEINESIALTAYAGHSWAMNRDPSKPDDELLKSFFHGGIGVSWSFSARKR